ncbi:MAG: hypothetical protein IMZ58_00255 [Thermoplasmata archaeon]|nr:hypothetical protein [Thermoplasmata archaeon]
MKKQIVIAIIVGIIVTFIVGLLMGWSIPRDNVSITRDNVMLTGERSHLIGSWKGSNSSSTFSLKFFENGSLLFSSYLGNFTVNQDQLILHNQGITMTAEFFFIGDYNTLGLTNIKSSSSFGFGYFGIPYGIILQRV